MKYKLGEKHPDLDLYRVVALKDFGNVEKGDVGGWVESEKNLSQEGDCWVYDKARVFWDAYVYGKAQVFGDARVFGSAMVFESAEVSGNAEVSGSAQVYGSAMVFDNAEVSGSAQVFGDARVFGSAMVFDNAEVSGSAQVYGSAKVSGDSICTRKVYIIELDRDSITTTDNHIQIGCEFHTYEYWMENYRQIGEKNDYTEGQIERYGAIIKVLYGIKQENS